jgi:hypothetical protein
LQESKKRGARSKSRSPPGIEAGFAALSPKWRAADRPGLPFTTRSLTKTWKAGKKPDFRHDHRPPTGDVSAETEAQAARHGTPGT